MLPCHVKRPVKKSIINMIMKMNEIRMMSNECINEYKLKMICSRGCQQVQLICISEEVVCVCGVLQVVTHLACYELADPLIKDS